MPMTDQTDTVPWNEQLPWKALARQARKDLSAGED